MTAAALHPHLTLMVVGHIEELYGKGATKAILTVLGQFPQNEEGFEFAKHNKRYTDQLFASIEKVLGVDRDTFNRQWTTWIQHQADRAAN